MAEPYLADIVGQYQRGQAIGTAQRQEREERARQSRLSELASLAYGAQGPERQAAIGQAYGVDPQFAAQLSGQLGREDESRQTALLQSARLLQSAPPESRPALYQRIRPSLSQYLPDLPPEYSDQVEQGTRAFIAAYGGPGGGDVKVVGNALVDPTGRVIYEAPQRFQTDAGLIEVGPQGAREITLGAVNPPGVYIDPSLPPEVQADIRARPDFYAQAPEAATVPDQTAIGAVGDRILPRGASAEQERLRLAREANARAEQANQRAQEAADRAKRASEAKGAVGKPLTQGVVTDLTKDAGKLENLSNLISTFKDDFAGNVVGGSVENFAGRNLPDFLSPATEGQAEWWQQYDRYKNEVRNELFGASLTAGEQAAFEAADIIPNMDPKVARKNLATQRDIIRKGLERKGRTWAAQGYNREAISEATGLNFRPQGGQGGGQASPAAPQRARNPQTGQVIELRNGQWVPVDG